MQARFKEDVRPKLELLNDLYDILGTSSDVNLPSIVVVGTQSSGKSSVLERLSGVELPRGERLCTRAPLVLSMKKGLKTEPCIAYELNNEPIRERVAMEDIADTLKSAMDKLTVSEGTQITSTPIRLDVQSPGLPDLTLVDLPGIVYTDLEETVKDMIQTHVNNGAAIILCVLSATEDVEANETLKIARKADPDGKRTVGVITKVDRLENTRRLPSMLSPDETARSYLKLGLIAVRNPSTADKSGTRKNADAKELEFFEPLKKNLLPDSFGIQALSSRLCELQAANVTERMPSMLADLQSKERDLQEALMKIRVPKDVCESMEIFTRDTEMLKKMMRDLANAHHDELENVIYGLAESDKAALRICPLLHRTFKTLRETLETLRPLVFSEEKLEEVKTELDSVEGGHLPNFLPPDVFNTLFRRWTVQYKLEVENTFNGACSVALAVAQKCVHTFVREKLGALIDPVLEDGLNERCDQAAEEVAAMLRQEFSIFHTENSYYTETLKKIREQLARRAETSTKRIFDEDPVTPEKDLAKLVDIDDGVAKTLLQRYQSHDPNEMKALELQMSIFAYDKVVRKRIVDGLMQKSQYALLNFFKDEDRVLNKALQKVADDKATIHDRLTKQPPAEAQRRQNLEHRLKKLDSAIKKVKAAGGYSLNSQASGGVEPRPRKLRRLSTC